jgi:hypothetical protein
MDYLESIDYRIPYISRHFNIASPRSKGIFHGNYFYIEQDLYDNYFDLDWREVTPLKPVFSTNRSFRMDHPSDMTDHITFSYIDYRALMVQYWHWSKYQLSIDGPLDFHIFVNQYPYTNMIKYFFNLSIVNLAFKGSNESYPNPHPFLQIDRSKTYAEIFRKFRKYAKLKPILLESSDKMSGGSGS